MFKIFRIVSVSMVLLLFGISPILIPGSASRALADDGQAEIAEGNNDFTLALYDLLRSAEGNLFVSPFSIRTAFAMVYGGARGDTAGQMAAALRFSEEQTAFHEAMGAFIDDLNRGGGKYDLVVSNALWGQTGYPFRKAFLQLNKKQYGAGMKLVDFINQTERARLRINAWVEKKTKKKIKDLLQKGSLNETARLVVTNAIYFKGTWVDQFDKRATYNDSFTTLTGNTVTAAYMNRYIYNGIYLDNGQIKLLELPYEGDRIVMTILLPSPNYGMGKLEKRISCRRIESWLSAAVKTDIDLRLPKFGFTSEFELIEALRKLGMEDAFCDQGDFTGISPTGELFISGVIHKALVEVNEKGTVAAGATAITFGDIAKPQHEFHADRPFLFLIRDTTTGAILFMGRVVDPSRE